LFIKRVGIIEAERRFVQFDVILHLCPHLILNLFSLIFFSAPGWKKSGINNQRLATAGEFLPTFLLYSCIVHVCVCGQKVPLRKLLLGGHFGNVPGKLKYFLTIYQVSQLILGMTTFVLTNCQDYISIT